MKRLFGLLAVLLCAVGMSFGQAVSANGGSIAGTISDPTGAIIPGATVTITGLDTGLLKVIKSDSAGFYSIGPLNPGNYNVTVSMTGFEKLSVKTVVRTGTVTNGNFKLTLGESSQTIEVDAGAVQVNTEQPGVADVLTKQQIDSMPVNGRNFLDLMQAQPGVIMQSGEGFDPTKAGYSAVAVDGVSGRTTRILYDGQDITDETVGTTIINVPTGAVDEAQLNRSTQDVSGEVTSTGQLLTTSPSGTNSFHGEAFYLFQDHRAAFARTVGGVDQPFQRNQFGGSFGGPIFHDKLFFFGDLERIKQDQQNTANASPTFSSILAQYPTYPTPFRDTFSMARLDYNNGPFHGHYFARAFYEVNADAGNFGYLYQVYTNRDNTPGIVGGADFGSGHWTHSFRGGYEKFHNLIVDDTAGNHSIYNPNNGLNIYDGTDGFAAGPNLLAPQGTFQSDKQLRYDGTWTHGKHTLKFGVSVNRLLGGGFAAFFSLAPQVTFGPNQILANCGNVTGAPSCASDPLNGYNLGGGVIIGNGNGIFTEKPGFGLPGGGQSDWRSGYYLADTWKVSQYVTLTAGMRYSIDTGRANQDLPVPTCGEAIANGFALPCSGNTSLFTQFNPAWTQTHVHQPYGNFGPQLGFVYSPGSHKMSIRGGIGIFYESDIFNNTGNSRPSVLNASGPFFGNTAICGPYPTSINAPGGTVITSGTANGNTIPITTLCGMPIGQAAPYITDIYSQYRAATVANNNGPNGSFVAGLLGFTSTYGTQGAYAPNYRTPYSIQYNGGIQYEITKGMVVSADYIHNSTLKVPLMVDQNHVGDANYLNKAAALNAIATTVSTFGTCSGTSAASIDCAITNGAQITDFAGPHYDSNGNMLDGGLDSGTTSLGGIPAQAHGVTPSTGAAFPGINTAVGNGILVTPTGQSGYDALQVLVKQIRNHPMPGVASANFQIAYAFSRIISDAGFGGTSSIGTSDQFFSSYPVDYRDPKSFMGRNSNDHTHILSFIGSFQIHHGPQVSLGGHFISAGASTLTLPATGAPGEIFRTDVTGDGTTGDLVPGTEVGAYMHQVKPGKLASVISNYNSTQAGTITPAGQALVNAGLFTQSQLAQLGAVKPTLQSAPSNGPMPNSAFRDLDMGLSYPFSLHWVREGMTLSPSINFYNVGNFSNFGRLTGDLIAVGTPLGSNLNGANTPAIQNGVRTQRGSGTNDQGAPRSTEFGLTLKF